MAQRSWRRSIFSTLTLLAAVSTPRLVHADVKLAHIFSDHMVLQRDAKAPIWGWADPGEKVTVTFGDASESATTGDDGRWMVQLQSLKANANGADLIAAGKNSVALHDVVVGDVWVCSGQSNMEFGLAGANNAKTEISKSDNPKLRLFLLGHKIAFAPQTDCTGSWELCTPQSSPRFSAVGYFFGKEVEETQNVPVGLIGTYWGGTPVQSWTSREELLTDPALKRLVADPSFDPAKAEQMVANHDKWMAEGGREYQTAMAAWNAAARKAAAAKTPPPPKPTIATPEPADPTNPYRATVLFNGMINPIIPLGIKGAIWYQGESNAGDGAFYRKQFPAMIADWRSRWGEGDFPFLFVQLANFHDRKNEPANSQWAELREAQLFTLTASPNTGMAVIIDIGQGDNIHPKDKADVGHRLALASRHVAYGDNAVVYSGPIFDSMQIDGDKATVKFKNTGSGLTIAAAPSTQPDMPATEPSSQLEGFAIAGSNLKFVWAQAEIAGSDTVIVHADTVKQPTAVRYGWADNPKVNLYNKEGLPASPFRTDGQPGNPTSKPAN